MLLLKPVFVGCILVVLRIQITLDSGYLRTLPISLSLLLLLEGLLLLVKTLFLLTQSLGLTSRGHGRHYWRA
jgi:hypothetical protein